MLRLRFAPSALVLALARGASTEITQPTIAPAPAPGLHFTAGQLVINEVDPSAVADTDGEWFEVTNRCTSSVDLQGWTIAGNTTASVIDVQARGILREMERIARQATSTEAE